MLTCFSLLIFAITKFLIIDRELPSCVIKQRAMEA